MKYAILTKNMKSSDRFRTVFDSAVLCSFSASPFIVRPHSTRLIKILRTRSSAKYGSICNTVHFNQINDNWYDACYEKFKMWLLAKMLHHLVQFVLCVPSFSRVNENLASRMIICGRTNRGTVASKSRKSRKCCLLVRTESKFKSSLRIQKALKEAISNALKISKIFLKRT